ncbi:hypothetical protein PTNB85_06759 [Pyrenophora teres f. teres]|nr:hypothetical protein PTNB85_06759 [Pyrenophora teres f. teres]
MGSLAEGELKQPQGQLLVHAIDEKAQWIPDQTYMRYAPKDWEQAGYRAITWKQFAGAINKVAYWFDEKFGKASTCDTVAYFGPNDPRYAILIPAIIKHGRKLLVPDGRITKEGLDGLVESTNCKVWLYAEDDARGPLVKPESGLKILALPRLQWMLDNEGQKRYPYEKTYEEAEWDEIIIIHTSGTTGVPKPIYLTNGLWAAYKNVSVLSRRHWPRGLAYESWIGKTNLNPCPPQWLAGLHAMIISPVFLDSPCIMLPLGEASLTPRTFKKIIEMNKVDGMRCPPYTITTLYDDPASKELLRSLEFVVYLGAPLNQAIGDDLCQYTRLSPAIGSTESGDQLSFRPVNRKLWYTHDFVPENGHKMVPLDIPGENLHELVLEAPKNGRMNPFQLAFWNTAHRYLDRIEMKELYRPVTDSDGRTRWEFSARKDDLTKLSWLAKFNAQDIESRILLHPDVEQVLVGGEGRPTPYVIMQAKIGALDRKSEAQLLDELYEHVITGTNKADIDEIRIPKETLLLAKKEKPFQVNLKQVVQRRAVEQDYLGEIEQAYLRLENNGIAMLAITFHSRLLFHVAPMESYGLDSVPNLEEIGKHNVAGLIAIVAACLFVLALFAYYVVRTRKTHIEHLWGFIKRTWTYNLIRGRRDANTGIALATLNPSGQQPVAPPAHIPTQTHIASPLPNGISSSQAPTSVQQRSTSRGEGIADGDECNRTQHPNNRPSEAS